MEQSLIDVRRQMFPLVDKTASYIHQYLDSKYGAEPRRQLTVIVSSLRQVKHTLLSEGNLGGIHVEKDPLEVNSDFVIGVMDQFQLDHKFDPVDLVNDLLKDFKTINPSCEVDNEEGLSEETLRSNRTKFRDHVISFIDLLVEELEPEVSLNLKQLERIEQISDEFLKRADARRTGEELVNRRSTLSRSLLRIAGKFIPNDIDSGGHIERVLDTDFERFIGTEPVFHIKRLAFPYGNEYEETKAEFASSRNTNGKISVGEIVVVFDDKAKTVIGYEVTGIEEDKIKAIQIDIENKRRGPLNYFASNIPEYLANRKNNGNGVEVEISKDISGKSFNNLGQLKDFLSTIDLRKYGVYTFMCRYFVSYLRNRIRREGYKLNS